MKISLIILLISSSLLSQSQDIKIKNYSENPKGVISYGDVYNENGDKLNLKYKGISKNLGIFKVEKINNRVGFLPLNEFCHLKEDYQNHLLMNV